jgi:hypothetical protein
MLAIEIDGDSHENAEIANNDQIRQRKLEELGVTVLRFDDKDVKRNMNWVLDEIIFWIKEHCQDPPLPLRGGECSFQDWKLVWINEICLDRNLIMSALPNRTLLEKVSAIGCRREKSTHKGNYTELGKWTPLLWSSEEGNVLPGLKLVGMNKIGLDSNLIMAALPNWTLLENVSAVGCRIEEVTIKEITPYLEDELPSFGGAGVGFEGKATNENETS